jgi:hypothetical protein
MFCAEKTAEAMEKTQLIEQLIAILEQKTADKVVLTHATTTLGAYARYAGSDNTLLPCILWHCRGGKEQVESSPCCAFTCASAAE